MRGPYPLGTDAVGRDLLSNILFGLRSSMVFPLPSMAISVALGVAASVRAGYYPARVDAFFMRAADMQLSLPFLLMALAIAAIWGCSRGWRSPRGRYRPHLPATRAREG